MMKMLESPTDTVVLLLMILCIVGAIATAIGSLADKAKANRDVRIADYRERKAERRRRTEERRDEPPPEA